MFNLVSFIEILKRFPKIFIRSILVTNEFDPCILFPKHLLFDKLVFSFFVFIALDPQNHHFICSEKIVCEGV